MDGNRTKSPGDIYSTASKFIPENFYSLLKSQCLNYGWTNDSKVWFLSKEDNRNYFKIFDPVKEEIVAAFDHHKVADLLSKSIDKTINENNLPFDSINLSDGILNFKIENSEFYIDLNKESINEKDIKSIVTQLNSPNGKLSIRHKEYNVYLINHLNQTEQQITTDGTKDFCYGKYPDCDTNVLSRLQSAEPPPCLGLWSNDSTKVLIAKIDERSVKKLHLLQNSPKDKPSRPKLFEYRYPFPTDEMLPQSYLLIYDIKKDKLITVDIPSQIIGAFDPIQSGLVWWCKDSKYLYYIYPDRHFKHLKLLEINADSGSYRIILEEKGETFVETTPFLLVKPNVEILTKKNEFIWCSERDGWFHLYRYQLSTGKLINQITQGPWVVQKLLLVNENDETIYFYGGTKVGTTDPYYSYLYRVKFDGSELKLLTHAEGHHKITFSPSQTNYIDEYSTIYSPPIIKFNSLESEKSLSIFESQLSNKIKFKPPEPFKILSSDKKTFFYGAIFKPSFFNPNNKYEVIESIYPGPQQIQCQKSFFPVKRQIEQSIAELGFIIVSVDCYGNQLRSKQNHDTHYGSLSKAGGLEDHIFVLKALATKYPFMNINRVGIVGHSGGGYAAARAILSFPDFYKVAVSISGNHDQRTFVSLWGDLYGGKYPNKDYDIQANYLLAKNLKGKLLLMHGELDDNVHPLNTMRLIDELINADKDFDQLILPNLRHDLLNSKYVIKRIWNYFYEHLKKKEPPPNYKINKV